MIIDITDWHRREVFHSREASVAENLLPENVNFADGYGVDVAASQQQTQPMFAASPGYPSFISNQYIVNPVPGVVL